METFQYLKGLFFKHFEWLLNKQAVNGPSAQEVQGVRVQVVQGIDEDLVNPSYRLTQVYQLLMPRQWAFRAFGVSHSKAIEDCKYIYIDWREFHAWNTIL